MKRTVNFALIATVVGVTCLGSKLEARTCSGNGDVIGSFGFVGSRAFSPGLQPVLPPGTTSVTVIGSSTNVGSLIAGTANTALFSVAGRIYADGAGNLLAALDAISPSNTRVGTYSVNTDCTISMTLRDAFSPNATLPSGTGGPLTATATLEGVLVDNGDEIDLVQTAVGAGTGALVTLRKTAQFNGCTNGSLVGSFGFEAIGVENGPAPAVGATPSQVGLNIVGRLVADGQGNFVTDALASLSPLKRQITGTYTVNSDCTGTAVLIDSNGKTRNATFVLTREGASCSSGSQSGNANAVRFGFTDSGVFATGIAKQQ